MSQQDEQAQHIQQQLQQAQQQQAQQQQQYLLQQQQQSAKHFPPSGTASAAGSPTPTQAFVPAAVTASAAAHADPATAPSMPPASVPSDSPKPSVEAVRTQLATMSVAAAQPQPPQPVAVTDLVWNRESFVRLLTDAALAAEFKDFVLSKERKHSPPNKPMFQFLEGFWKLQEVLDDIKRNPTAPAKGPSNQSPRIIASHPVMREFASRVASKRRGSAATPLMITGDSLDDLVTVPFWLATQMLRYYATFIVPGAPEEIRPLTLKAREKIAESLLDLGGDRNISVHSFSPAAVEVIEHLFMAWFPKFLLAWGIAVPDITTGTSSGDESNSNGNGNGNGQTVPMPLVRGGASAGGSGSSDSRENMANIQPRTSSQPSMSSSPSLSSVTGSAAAGASNSSVIGFNADGRGTGRNSSSSSSGNLNNGNNSGSSTSNVAKQTGKAITSFFAKLKPKKAVKEEQLELGYSRDCLVRLFHHPTLYRDFALFVQSTHCGENLMFYEAFLKLESRLVSSAAGAATAANGVPVSSTGLPYEQSPCLERFIRVGGTTSQLSEEAVRSGTVPVILVPLVLLFHSMFIAPGSLHEVNLTHSMRKTIASELSRGRGLRIPITIFDDPIDHVLALLYDNSFKLYLKSKAQQQQQQQQDM
ncbi:hypothetical protein BC831DRAFT_469128 [Entophlyctis helioformis]|nr:hypothetical protein BC831DRAFT_469128 [Entophlyctis helioformis]